MAVFKYKIFIILLISISFYSFSQNQQIADSLLQTIENIEEDTTRIRDIIHFANNTYLNNPELSRIFTDEVLRQSVEANYKLGIADAYTLYGIIDMDLGKFESCNNNFYKALEIYHLTDNSYGVVNSYNNIGLTYSDLGKYVDALDSYIKALKVLESYDNDQLQTLIYSNLGKLYLEVNDQDKALEYLKKAEELGFNDKNSLIYVYNMLGTISLDKEEPDSALKYHKQAMQMSEELNNRVMISSTYLNIADVYFFTKEYDLTLENYHKSLKIAEDLNNSVNIIRVLNSLGYFHYYIIEFDKAEEYLIRSYNLSEDIGFQEGIKNSALHLSYVYNEIGEYKLAYDYRVYFDYIYENMYSNETFKSITELFTKLEQERKEYESQITIQKKKIKNLITYLVAVSLLILFAALYLIQRNVAKRAVRKQEYLDKELTLKAIFLVRKNEVFAKIENILNVNKDKFIKENQKVIQEIINEIKLAQNEEVWNEFELYFNKVHRNFHKKLNKDFPNLSVNERRLCALLRMTLTTKDISLITQQTSHTIDIARSRLRKKLGLLNKKISLYAFLAKY